MFSPIIADAIPLLIEKREEWIGASFANHNYKSFLILYVILPGSLIQSSYFHLAYQDRHESKDLRPTAANGFFLRTLKPFIFKLQEVWIVIRRPCISCRRKRIKRDRKRFAKSGLNYVFIHFHSPGAIALWCSIYSNVELIISITFDFITDELKLLECSKDDSSSMHGIDQPNRSWVKATEDHRENRIHWIHLGSWRAFQ